MNFNLNATARTNAGLCLAGLLSILGLAPSASRADDAVLPSGAPRYALTGVFALGAPDRWDYLFYDSEARRVYVSHGDEVTVVDGRNGTLVGNISGLPGSHGTVVIQALKRGFADSAKNKQVVAFDSATLRPVATAEAGADADGIAYDAASHRLFVADGDGQALTVIDAISERAVATLPLGGQPEFLVADGKGRVFVNIESTREIVAVDARRVAVAARWPIPDCESPHGLAMDPVTQRLFASCANGKLFVVDAGSGHIVAALPIGKGSDAAAFDPKRKLVFSSNGEGTLSVIAEKSADAFVALGNVPTVRGARTMALDTETGRIFLVSADVDRFDPPKAPGGHPHAVYKPGSVKLYFFDPVR